MNLFKVIETVDGSELLFFQCYSVTSRRSPWSCDKLKTTDS